MSFTYANGIRWLADLPERHPGPLDAWICRPGEAPRPRSSRGIEPDLVER
jgi:hypothetical protein